MFFGPISNRSLSQARCYKRAACFVDESQTPVLSTWPSAMFPLLLPFLPAAFVVVSVLASPLHPGPHGEDNSTSNGSLSPAPAANTSTSARRPNSGPDCFPAIGFKTPSNVPSSLDGWWCDPATEYAFVGFSYEVTACEFVFFNEVVLSSA